MDVDVLADGHVGSSGADDLSVTNHVLTLDNCAKRYLVAAGYRITYFDDDFPGSGVCPCVEVDRCGCDVVPLIENYELHQTNANKVPAR